WNGSAPPVASTSTDHRPRTPSPSPTRPRNQPTAPARIQPTSTTRGLRRLKNSSRLSDRTGWFAPSRASRRLACAAPSRLDISGCKGSFPYRGGRPPEETHVPQSCTSVPCARDRRGDHLDPPDQ